ncbi:FHA domain-containing protein [Dyella sp.]|uniref:FHA domain-containing protein n=1 Tax=Dyella sp. TaxID=1869338 RepID=UPI002D7854C0|nr:FHA domain-containing protein [Dyella sp.]HET6431192.1 FHA domain-containing protein [Dyella sp.]
MNGPVPVPRRRNDPRTAGPQGTRLFTAEELAQYADAVAPAPPGPASTAQPVLLGRSEGLGTVRFALRSGRQTLGRRSDNDIVVNEPSVSASHAWVINQQGHYVIMNTLSTNGTFVNGKRVHEAVLKHGDCVRLGQAEFVFLTRERGERRRRSAGWITAAAAFALGALAVLAWWLR